jgi:hypothetical protein
MEDKYKIWISEYLIKNNMSVRGQCVYACAEMKKVFPELSEVRGFYGGNEHVWLVDKSGVVVDPTESQFIPGFEYKEFEPGDLVCVGKCMNCGNKIYDKILDLEDPSYARSVCSDECRKEFVRSLE